MSKEIKKYFSACIKQRNYDGGVAYLQSLHKLIAAYDVILLDTTVVLHPGFETLLSDLILILRQYHKNLTVLTCVVDRLSQLANDTKAGESAAAKRALEIIRILQNHNTAVVIRAGFLGGIESRDILSYIYEIAFSRNVLLLTQSGALAMDCALLGWLQSCRLQSVSVRQICNTQGQLGEFCSKGSD